MKYTDELISRYAKKIYGFAYSKTHNTSDAEDLSQDILLELCKIDFENKQINYMDSYIYRVCQYTWSNRVRRSKQDWEMTFICEENFNIADDYNLEAQVVSTDLYDNLRREVMFLAKTKRDVIVMFYYEGKSGREIAEILGIPPATVRWHLGEAKKKIKEHIEMENIIYQPKKLNFSFCGNSCTNDLGGLRNDLLMQNICIICQGRTLTVEDIAHELCISAAFVEDKLEKLLYMNYLEKVGSNKYTCTFFIRTDEFTRKIREFNMKNNPVVAKALHAAVAKRFDELLGIGFLGCDLDRDFLMWAFAADAAYHLFAKFEPECKFEAPIRGDGSKFFLMTSYSDEGRKYTDKRERELAEYGKKSSGGAGMHSGSNMGVYLRQHDPACVTAYRVISFDKEMCHRIKMAYKLIVDSEEADEYDKLNIAELCKRGLAKMIDGKVKLNIPYFTSAEYKEIERILTEAATEAVEQVGNPMTAYAEYIDKYIPDFVSDEEREFLRNHYYEINGYLWELLRSGCLRMPTEEEKKAICTIAFEY